MKKLTKNQIKERNIIIAKMVKAKGTVSGLIWVEKNIKIINALAAYATK